MSDYDRIAQAIAFITSRVNAQPTLTEIAAHLHMSPYHFQRLFCRWAGVTPKRFLQVLTLERAKILLDESKSLLEVSNAIGLSSGSRLYDHFVQLEAMTPGEYKKGGAGLTIDYAVHDTPFGEAFIATTKRGVCQFAFLDSSDIKMFLSDLINKWPHAVLREDHQRTRTIAEAMFDREKKLDRPLSLHVSGTNFQVSVWKALLQIPPGTVVSYSLGGIGNWPSTFCQSCRYRDRREPCCLPDPLSSCYQTKRQSWRLPLGRNPNACHARMGIRET